MHWASGGDTFTVTSGGHNKERIFPAMPKRAFIIHGYQSYPQEAWLPWLQDQLEARGYVVSLPAMPHPDHPIIRDWIDFIAHLVGEPDKMTFMIGHSIGAQAVLRYLETLAGRGQSVAKTVLVAGIFPTGMSLAEAERETEGNSVLVPWFSQGIDPARVKSAAGQCTVILSDNDPYIDTEKANTVFRATLDPRIIVEPGKGHFNEDDHLAELPSALAAVIS